MPRPGRAGERVKEKRSSRQATARDAHRWTIAVDCDGVLHSYRSGWQGAEVLPDPPVDGAIEWLEDVTKHFEVAVHSTRCASEAGRWAIDGWLREHGLSEAALAHISYAQAKPAALIYLDDRGVRFDGEHFPSVGEIWQLKPWGVAEKLGASG